MSQTFDHLCKDSGITLKLRKVSPMLAADIEALFPKPQPPEQEVEYPEPKGKVMEKNLSDPAYEKALEDRSAQVYQAWKRALLLRGVVLEGDDWKKDVAEYRQFIQETTGQPLAETDDRMIYILRVAVNSIEDNQELIEAITRRSQPTPEVVQAARESFQRKN